MKISISALLCYFTFVDPNITVTVKKNHSLATWFQCALHKFNTHLKSEMTSGLDVAASNMESFKNHLNVGWGNPDISQPISSC